MGIFLKLKLKLKLKEKEKKRKRKRKFVNWIWLRKGVAMKREKCSYLGYSYHFVFLYTFYSERRNRFRSSTCNNFNDISIFFFFFFFLSKTSYISLTPYHLQNNNNNNNNNNKSQVIGSHFKINLLFMINKDLSNKIIWKWHT